VSRILDRYDNQYDRLVEMLTGMLAHREQWIGHLLSHQAGQGFDRAGLEGSLRLLIESELSTAREGIPDECLAELPRFLEYAMTHLAPEDAGVRALLDSCGGPGCDFLDLPVEAGALPHWLTLIGFLLNKGGGWWAAPGKAIGFPAPSQAKGEEKANRTFWKDGFTALLNTLRDDTDLQAQLNTIRRLPRPDYDDEAWASLESLMRILIRAFQEWSLVMSETGQTDFSEIASRAIEALGSHEAPSALPGHVADPDPAAGKADGGLDRRGRQNPVPGR
jgi:ATP-dependent helicase/nuclease subunit A